MTCDCIATVNAKLAPDHLLNATMAFRAGEQSLPIMNLIRRDTWKPETRRSKTSFMVATFCPFCGERYERTPAAAAQPSPRQVDGEGSREHSK